MPLTFTKWIRYLADKTKTIEFGFSVSLPGSFKWRKKVKLTGLVFALSFIYLFFVGVETRLEFLRVLPSALVAPDSYSYLPLWAYYNTVRTPFYRIFLIVVCKLTGSYFYAVVVQHALTVLAAALIAFAVWFALRKIKAGWLSLAAALLVSYLVLFDNNLLMYEHWILTDYWLAILLIVIAASFCLLAYRPNTFSVLLLASAILLAILIRPVGIYLLPIGLIMVLFIAWKQQSNIIQLGLIYSLLVAVVMLSFCYYNYHRFGYFGVSTNGTQQLFALVADAGALDMKSDTNLKYKNMIRVSYEHYLKKYPPERIHGKGNIYIGWPLYVGSNPEPKYLPPAQIIAKSVGGKEAEWGPILQSLAVEGLIKHPGRYFEFASTYMGKYLTYTLGSDLLIAETFFPAFDAIKQYTDTYKAILPSVSKNYPPLIPVFENYKNFYDKHSKQPWLQRHSLIFAWILLPFVLLELVWPRVLSKKNHAFLLSLYLMAIGQGFMGFFCIGTGRYILPMAVISYPCFTFGLVVFILQIQHLAEWSLKKWAKK